MGATITTTAIIKIIIDSCNDVVIKCIHYQPFGKMDCELG